MQILLIEDNSNKLKQIKKSTHGNLSRVKYRRGIFL